MMKEDRLRALTLTGVNLVVEAGAGTGKTTLLIDRLCLCVLAQQIPVEKLVALTFTEKAAAEIKTRFIFKLQQLLELIQAEETTGTDPQVYQTDKKYRTLRLLREKFGLANGDLISRAQAALARLDRASIGTIHSFCAEILKMFPLEAGLSPLAQIDTGQKAVQLFEERWNRFLDRELGENAPRANHWKEVLGTLSLEDLKELATSLAALKPVEYDYYSHRSMLIKLCAQKAQQMQELAQAHMPASHKPRAIEKALLWAADSLVRTQAFLEGKDIPPASQEPCPGLSATLCKGWEADEQEEARGLVSFAQKITPENQKLFLRACELVRPLAQEVRLLYEQEGVLSFDDLIIKTRNLLAQNLYVRRLLKERFDVLFIDEFQDTDPVQGELLLFLAEEKPGAAARWQEVHLQPGKLLVVGDPKQSIYRFRGADITAYELFTDLILKQGGQKCFLQQNYRSQPEIVTLANEVCARAMVQESAFQPAYVPIFTQKSSRGQAVQWLFVRAPQGEKVCADDFRHNQAEQMACWICENVGVLELSNGKKLSYGDIALLTRVGTNTRIYTDAFRRHNIPFITETDKDFFHKQEINDLVLFLQAIADPEDKIALAGVLRSPLGALTDEQLYHLANQGKINLPALLQDPQTAACAKQIAHFAQVAGRVSLKELLVQILDQTFLPEICAAAYDGERSLAYLQQFVELAEQYQAQQNVSLSAFLADLQERLANPADFVLPPADETADAVSLLTVHKSKGLEFPVVILADLSRKETGASGKPASHLFSWQYNMYGLRAGALCDINLAFLEEEQKKHSRCEEVRILYVALTRAKEKLILAADNRDGAVKAARPFSSVGIFPDGQAQTVGELNVPVLYRAYQDPRTFIYQQRPSAVSTDEIKKVDDWKHAYEKRLKTYRELLSQSHKQAPSQLEGDEPLTQEQELGAELGTVCHCALEALFTHPDIALEQACAWGAKRAGAIARTSEAVGVLAPFVTSPLYRALTTYKLLAAEMPFALPVGNQSVQQGIIDAIFELPDGTLWLVDYKTDRVSPGKEAALFDKKYRAQLAVYHRAAQQLFTGKTVRASAVFVRTFAAIDL